MSALRISAKLVTAHLIAWTLAFVLVAGFDVKLMPSYFAWGWSFAGGELPTSIWLLSWPIFLVILLAWASARWARHRRRS